MPLFEDIGLGLGLGPGLSVSLDLGLGPGPGLGPGLRIVDRASELCVRVRDEW